MQKLKNLWLLLFGFEGKISKKHYILFILLWIPLSFIIFFISNLASLIILIGVKYNRAFEWYSSIIFLALSLPIIHSYMTRWTNSIERGYELIKFYKFIIFMVILLGVILIASLGEYFSPLIFIVSPIYMSSFIIMLILAFYKI